MEVFAFHEELVAEYGRSSRSFPNIRANDVAREVDAAPAGGRFWPAPQNQLNSHFRPGGWADNFIGDGTLDAECAKGLDAAVRIIAAHKANRKEVADYEHNARQD